MKYRFIFGLIISCCLLSSCANRMSMDQCVQQNWYQLGLQHGQNGHPMSSLHKYHKNCARYGVMINTPEYQRGWNLGIRSYCTAENGLHIGSAGNDYINYCPEDLQASFQQAWSKGIRSYCTKQNGFARGKAGRAYSGFCPADLNQEFYAAYQRGYQYNKRLHDLQREKSRLESELRLKRNEYRYMYPSEREQHPNMLQEIQHMEDRLDRIKSDIFKLEVKKR